MTFVVAERKICPWDNSAINLCEFRGNGKEPDYCNRVCGRRMYNFRRIYDNTKQQLQLMGRKVPETGKLSKMTVRFFELADEYISLGLRADVLRIYLDAMIDGKDCCIVESLFQKRIEEGRKLY